MNNIFSKASELERICINADAQFLIELTLSLLQKHKRASGLFSPNILPYFSLFVLESYNYLQEKLPQHTLSLSSQFEPIIRASRLRIKFFEDKKSQVQGIFELLQWVKEFHEEWHMGSHKGFLAPIKRLLQDDFGIYLYKRQIVGTTHTNFTSLGVSETDVPNTSIQISNALRPMFYSFGEELGGYTSQVLAIPEIGQFPNVTKPLTYHLNDDELKYVDTKSDKFLRTVFNGDANESINLTLLMFLTQVNFLRFILAPLMESSTHTLFKYKYITLYHTYAGLKRLQQYSYQKGLLTNHSQNHLQKIISNKQLKKIVGRSKPRKFRNCLVHYTADIPENAIDLTLTSSWYGLIEYYFDGMSFSELSTEVDKQLADVSQILNEWLGWQPRPNQMKSW